VSFAAITICVASERVFVVVYFGMTKSGNFWIYPHMLFLVAISHFIKQVEGKSKLFPVLNYAPRHEEVLGQLRYSSTPSWPRHQMEVSCQASHPGRFAPGERVIAIHWMGG
jgi:hypothetical protein